MLVRVLFGSRSGEVCDFLPSEARAMLADGRAVLPETDTAPPLVSDRVAFRDDRGMPRGKRRAHR